jgi:hypothetical protein
MDVKQYAYFKIEDDEIEKNKKIKNRLYNCVSDYKSNTLMTFEPRPNTLTSDLYTVLNYDKNMFSFDEPMKHRQCRSVILSYPENALLSFSPPKSLTVDFFMKSFPEYDETIYANEQIEGTLLHLFFDQKKKSWEIATKKAVGGNYSTFYYKNPKMAKTSVRNMFLSALGVKANTDLNEIRQLLYLSTDYSYCFILQHPENHIVFNIKTPALYLIAVYDILPISRRVISIPQFIYKQWNSIIEIPEIKFPRTIELNSYEEYKSYFTDKCIYDIKGIVITNTTNGEHCVIKNPIYEDIAIPKKGYMNSLHFQYLCLRRIGKTSDFLLHFPQHKKAFDIFYSKLSCFVQSLHETYMMKYVWKQ